MEEFNDLKNIWSQQKVPHQEYETFLAEAKSYAKKEKFKNLKANIILLFTCIFIGILWWYYQPQYISTKLGIVIAILTMLVYLFYYNDAYRLIIQPSEEIGSKQFLKKLLSFKQKQKMLQTKGINLYLLFIFLGVILYMYEYASRMSLEGIVITYGVVIVWFAFNWLYFKPRIIKKQNEKLNHIINALQKIENQLN